SSERQIEKPISEFRIPGSQRRQDVLQAVGNTVYQRTRGEFKRQLWIRVDCLLGDLEKLFAARGAIIKRPPILLLIRFLLGKFLQEFFGQLAVAFMGDGQNAGAQLRPLRTSEKIFEALVLGCVRNLRDEFPG